MGDHSTGWLRRLSFKGYGFLITPAKCLLFVIKNACDGKKFIKAQFFLNKKVVFEDGIGETTKAPQSIIDCGALVVYYPENQECIRIGCSMY